MPFFGPVGKVHETSPFSPFRVAYCPTATISHAYALSDVSRDEARRISTRLAEAGVSILTNAPGDHPFPPVDVLRAEEVHVFAGNDNIRDAWWPYGNGDLLLRKSTRPETAGVRYW